MNGYHYTCDGKHIHPDISPLAKTLPENAFILDMADFFKTVSDPTRLKMLLALDKGELCGCDLAVLLGVTKSVVSRHLSLLRSARLVKQRREGQHVFYSLADKHVKQIVECAEAHLKEEDL